MDQHVDLQQRDDSTIPESTDPPPRMTRPQILTLASLAFINFSSMICYSILGPFFPKEAVKKGVSQTVIGLIFGCHAVCNLIGSLILGKYIAQIGAKFMLVTGIFVSSVCTILFGLLDWVQAGPAFISLCFLVRCVSGVSVAAAMSSSFAITAKTFPNNMACVLGILESCTGVGLIVGPPVGAWLYQAFGYEVPFILLGCLLFILVPVNIYILPTIDAVPSEDSFFRLLSHKKIVVMCYVIFTLSAGLGFLDATLSLFAMEMFNLSSAKVGCIMLSMFLPYSLVSPLTGRFTDKYPATRTWCMMIASIVTAVGFFLLGPVPFLCIPSQLWLLILMLVVIGFSLGITIIPTYPEIITCAHEQGFEEGLSTLGMVSGLFGAFWCMGMIYGPVVGGVITQHLSFEWAAAIQGCLAFLAAFFLIVYHLSERPQQQSVQEYRSTQTDERTPLLRNESLSHT